MSRSLASKRNIVAITVDSLRADYCYDPAVSTPALESLADSGIRFETAITPGPSTYTSMPAIFTGTQPGRPSASGGVNQRDRLRTHLRTHRPFPVRLREQGYTTIGITPNPFTSRLFGFDTGFDRFVDFFDSSGFGGSLRRRIVSRWAGGRQVAGLRFVSNMLGIGDVSVSCSAVVSQATEELREVSEPFFLWLMFLDPHWPYRPPRGYRDGTGLISRYRANWRASNLSDAKPTEKDAETLRRLYKGTIRRVDTCVASLRERLSDFDPVFVVHADHGEAFGEHGSFGHGGLLYEENIRVPLVVGNVGSHQPATDPISLRSLPRLFLGLSEGKPAFSNLTSPRTYATSEAGDLCVRGPSWKYYAGVDGDRFFNLQIDPEEQDGIQADLDPFGRAYQARLGEFAALENTIRDELPMQRL